MHERSQISHGGISWNGTSILPPQKPGYCTYRTRGGRGERVHCGEKSGFTSSGQRHDISPKEMVVRKVIYEYPCIYGCGAHESLVVPRAFLLHQTGQGTRLMAQAARRQNTARATKLSSKLGIYGGHRACESTAVPFWDG